MNNAAAAAVSASVAADVYTPVYIERSTFAATPNDRWMTQDGIEVVEGPKWHGRSPARKYLASDAAGDYCGVGPTKEAAVADIRAKMAVRA